MTTKKPGYNNRYYKRKRKDVVAALGGRCLICSLHDPIEIHHIEGYKDGAVSGKGQLVRLIDWLTHMDVLALLCEYHHKEYEFLYHNNINKSTLLDYILFKFIENTEWDQKCHL